MATIGPPVPGAPSLFSVAFDLRDVGYAVSEHVVTGTAERFTMPEPRTPDGRWSVEPEGAAGYTTRIVVHRPIDPARASGTVVVEWLNVTGGLDVPAVWMPTQRQLVRSGCTYVAVTAQRVGIEGGGVLPGLGLRDADPARYGSLHHPGDAHAFDLFSQVGEALPAFLRDEEGLPVERLLAIGASQSAFYLTTYVNALDPVHEVFDGFLLQGRAGAGAPIEGWDPETINPANATDPEARRARIAGRDHIREDTRVPVLVVQSETDVFGALGYLPARQPDGDRFRLWEVAGAAHCDSYFLVAAPRDSGRLGADELAPLIDNAAPPGIPVEVPINSGPQMHFVLQAAVDSLDTWVRTGTPPPRAARLEVEGTDGLAVDRLGIGRGGVRTPWVDVPTRVLSGLGQPGNLTDLFGTTRPLDSQVLADRYPGGRDDYVREFAASTAAVVDAGFLLAADAPEIDALGALAWPDTS